MSASIKSGLQNHIIQYPQDYSLCTGCMSCETLCALTHDQIVSPNRTKIKIEVGYTKDMIHTVIVCQQCSDHPCYYSCPKKDEAMCIDENGIVYVDKEKCIGCGLCAKACKYDPARIFIVKKDGKRYALKCDLCRDLPGGPACVEGCPAKCIDLRDNANEEGTRPRDWDESSVSKVEIVSGVPVAEVD